MENLQPLPFLCAIMTLLQPTSTHANDDLSPWKPGYAYNTHIAYQIQIENAELIPGTNKVFKGRYLVPKLIFAPVVEYTTSDVVEKGENRFAKRFYNTAYEAAHGLSEVDFKWKSDGWALSPKEWYYSYKRFTDNDLGELKTALKGLQKQHIEQQKRKEELDSDYNTANKAYEKAKRKYEEAKASNKSAEKLAKLKTQLDECDKRRMETGRLKAAWIATEPFKVFYDKNLAEVPFDDEKQALFLKWSADSVSRYCRGDKSDVLSVREGDEKSKQTLSTDEAKKRWTTGLADARPEIKDAILSEFGVTASALFDDPNGELRLLDVKSITERKPWKISAKAINGLLANGGGRDLIEFEGDLTVRAYPLTTNDLAEENLFITGWKIRAETSSKTKVKFKIGKDTSSFDVPIDLDNTNNINRVEFWFDTNNEVLRFAKIQIKVDDYSGNIPNPQLGTVLSKIQGKAKGKVVFECKYKTTIDKLVGADDVSENKK